MTRFAVLCVLFSCFACETPSAMTPAEMDRARDVVCAIVRSYPDSVPVRKVVALCDNEASLRECAEALEAVVHAE